MKKNAKIGVIVVALAIIIAGLLLIDYSNLAWSENSGTYLIILGMICTVGSVYLSIRNNKEEQAS